jgi:hypothetical protein
MTAVGQSVVVLYAVWGRVELISQRLARNVSDSTLQMYQYCTNGLERVISRR